MKTQGKQPQKDRGLYEYSTVHRKEKKKKTTTKKPKPEAVGGHGRRNKTKETSSNGWVGPGNQRKKVLTGSKRRSGRGKKMIGTGCLAGQTKKTCLDLQSWEPAQRGPLSERQGKKTGTKKNVKAASRPGPRSNDKKP